MMQASQLLPPQAPQAPQAPVVVQVTPSPVIAGSNPSAVLEAFRQQRYELRNQLERLESQRRDLSRQLQQPTVDGADEKGLEGRIASIDARIAAIDKQIADADASVARAAAVPGAVQPAPPAPPRSGPPEEFWAFLGLLTVIVVFPLTIAYARRIWRRGAQIVSAIPQELYDRFNRVDQAIDSVAVEVERIGEGQRFLTRVYAEQQRGLGAGPAERVEAPERERELQARK